MTLAQTDINSLRSTTNCHLLIPCAGVGARASINTLATANAKQYNKLAGKTVLEHTLAAFAGFTDIKCTVVVVSNTDFAINTIPLSGAQIARCGGDTRAATVRNGLAWLLQQGANATDWVLVHDAARCCITPGLIRQLMDAASADAVGGLLALPLPDTLKQATSGRAVLTLERVDKWLAQTPQMFRIGQLANALDAAIACNAAITDEASAMELAGFAPLLVPGSARNIKLTYPQDFALAQALLKLAAGDAATAES